MQFQHDTSDGFQRAFLLPGAYSPSFSTFHPRTHTNTLVGTLTDVGLLSQVTFRHTRLTFTHTASMRILLVVCRFSLRRCNQGRCGPWTVRYSDITSVSQTSRTTVHANVIGHSQLPPKVKTCFVLHTMLAVSACG